MNDSYPIEIFQTENGQIRLEVQLQEETVWLTQKQMGLLFERERSVVSKHINNIFKEGELIPDSVCANFAHTAEDGKTYQTRYFIIKDHPFADGNKRIGSFLFLLYLQSHGLHLTPGGRPRFADNALVALALLVAESDPGQKELMIRLIQHLMGEGV